MSEQTETEKQEQSRKNKRRSLCGQWLRRFFDIESAQWKVGRYHCGLWRDNFCLSCAESRQKYLMEKAQKAHLNLKVEGRKMIMIEEDPSRIDEVCRDLGKENYIRHPTNSFDVLFAPADQVDQDVINYDIMDDESLKSLPWEEIANTPEGRHCSGNLGQNVPELEKDEWEISVPQVLVLPEKNTTKIERLAWKRAIESITKGITKSIESQEDAQLLVDTMTAMITANFVEGGGTLIENIKVNPIKQRVKKSRIFTNKIMAGQAKTPTVMRDKATGMHIIDGVLIPF